MTCFPFVFVCSFGLALGEEVLHGGAGQAKTRSALSTRSGEDQGFDEEETNKRRTLWACRAIVQYMKVTKSVHQY